MKEIYTFLAVSALSVGMAAPVLAADVEDQREEVRQQSKDVREEQQDVREEQRDVRDAQREEQQDVRDEERDVREEKQDVNEARKDLRRDITQTHRATTVIGMNVRNPQDESLGEIHDLVLDFDKGGIAYVVVSSGGVLGVGDTLHAVRWKALKLNDKADAFLLNVDKSAWKKAPSFKANDWPEVADREWHRQLDGYYR